MGTWGTGAFDNDTASDWSGDLIEADDLSLVQETLSSAQEVDDDELDIELGLAALAACEVIARLQGRASRRSRPDVIDRWIQSHPHKPSPALIHLATTVLERLAQNDHGWKSTVQDLRRRVAGA